MEKDERSYVAVHYCGICGFSLYQTNEAAEAECRKRLESHVRRHAKVASEKTNATVCYILGEDRKEKNGQVC